MRTRVKTKTKFIVKPEDGVVVCNMEVDMQLPKFGYWVFNSKWWRAKAPKVDDFGEFTVTAIARCNADDNFNEVIGKRIAESRAKAKAFKIARNVWYSISKGLIERVNIANTMVKNCEIVRKAEVEHVKKLSE